MLQSKLLELAVHQRHEEEAGVLVKLAEQLQKAQANLVPAWGDGSGVVLYKMGVVILWEGQC